jgi:hypothetical protein
MTHEEAKAALLAHLPRWKARNVKTIAMYYSGSGDEGHTDGYDYNEETGYGDQPLHDEDSPKTYKLEDAFDSLAWANVSGNNDGGGGVITVDVDAGTITRKEFYYQQTTVDLETEEL